VYICKVIFSQLFLVFLYVAIFLHVINSNDDYDDDYCAVFPQQLSFLF